MKDRIKETTTKATKTLKLLHSFLRLLLELKIQWSFVLFRFSFLFVFFCFFLNLMKFEKWSTVAIKTKKQKKSERKYKKLLKGNLKQQLKV